MANLERRLHSLEDRLPAPQSPERLEARRRMLENLDRIATLRRSDSLEDRAALEEITVDAERRIAEHRGEVGR